MTKLSEILDAVFGAGYDQALRHASGGGNRTASSDALYKAKLDLEAYYTERFNKAIGEDEDRETVNHGVCNTACHAISEQVLRQGARKRFYENR